MTTGARHAILGKLARRNSMHIAPSHPFPRAARAHSATRVRWIVAGIEIVIGVGAVFGGYGLLSDAEGLGAKQAWLDGSVFPDYTVPGLFLLLVIGGGMFGAAAITVLARQHARVAAGVMAIVLALWGAMETVTIGWRGWQQIVLVGAFVVAPAVTLGLYAGRGQISPPRRVRH
jgi:hypothetical protein